MLKYRWPGKLLVTVPVIVAAVLVCAGATVADEDKITAGWNEYVRVVPSGLRLAAKLDTGADNSSLDASDVRFFRREGVRWVAFRIENNDGESANLERPVVRTTRIKNLDGGSLRRPTVRLGICLGPIFREVEVNLAQREGFKFNILVGRSFMAGRLLVDPARTFLTEPRCREVEGK